MDQPKTIREAIVHTRRISTSRNAKVLTELVVRALQEKGFVIPKIRIERLIKATRQVV